MSHGRFPDISELSQTVTFNLLSRWASINGSRPLPSCVVVDVAGSTRLGGTIPDGWGKPGRAFLITRGAPTTRPQIQMHPYRGRSPTVALKSLIGSDNSRCSM